MELLNANRAQPDVPKRYPLAPVPSSDVVVIPRCGNGLAERTTGVSSRYDVGVGDGVADQQRLRFPWGGGQSERADSLPGTCLSLAKTGRTGRLGRSAFTAHRQEPPAVLPAASEADRHQQSKKKLSHDFHRTCC